MRFPQLLHVTRERPANQDPYLMLHENGIGEIEQDGEPVATYRLVSVGKMEITKHLRERKTRRS